MNLILLSGGSGKRLWPLSNDVRSKQFIKIFKTETGNNDNSNNSNSGNSNNSNDNNSSNSNSENRNNGENDRYESMVQRVYRQIKTVDENATVTIATSKTQVSAIHNQLGENINICVEPCRRDTFPAIALASVYLHDVVGIGEDEAVVVCPVDPYVEDEYFHMIKKLGERAKESDANLILMGIEPTYPSEKYGYIIPENAEFISAVKTFKEKPDEKTAKAYMKRGALWNGGVFAYKLKYVLEKAHEQIDFIDYADLYEKYKTLEKISFDYAVVEKEEKIEVMRFCGEWKDLGTWNTLTEAMEEHAIGQAILNETCENTHVVNELNVPILCMGLKNCVVAASADGILVSDKEQSSYIKPFVDAIDQQIMFAEKSWGSYRVIDVQEESLTVLVTLNPNNKMNYHSHEHRDEVWTVISGEGEAVIDDVRQKVSSGDVITMQAGCKHTIIAKTELKLVEVQLGREINVYDKKKYE